MSENHRDWRTALIERYPDFFNITQQGRTYTPGYPSVGAGWRDLVETAVTRIANAVASAPDGLRITQIKEKYGTVRISWWGGPGCTDAMDAAVEEAVELAEARSACTCEQCGEPGRLFARGCWLMTSCDVHSEGDPVVERPGLENVHITHRFIDDKRVVQARRYIRDSDSFVEVDPSTLDLDEEE